MIAALYSAGAHGLLRVADFTAVLDKTAATLTLGQSAPFNVTLTSVNHYTSAITVFCESPMATVTCAVSPLPATLTDGGTVSLQLTIKDAAAAAASKLRHAVLKSPLGALLFSSLVPLCLGMISLKAKPSLGLLALTALAIMIFLWWRR